MVSVQRDRETGKIRLFMIFGNEDVNSIADVELHDVQVCRDTNKTPISGRIRQRTNPIVWESNESVQLTSGMCVRAAIKSPNLTGRYVIEGLVKGARLTGYGLTVEVMTSGRNDQQAMSLSELRFGDLPQRVRGDWMCIRVESENRLSPEQAAFIENTHRTYAVNLRLTREERRQYELIRTIVPGVYVPLLWQVKAQAVCDACNGEGHTSLDDMLYFCDRKQPLRYQEVYDVVTRVFFDSHPAGENVFPVGMLLRKYELETLSFEIQVR